MGLIVGNQKGVSLTSLVVGMGLTMIVFGIFGTFFVQQSQNMTRLQTNIEIMELQLGITKVINDENACSCMFNMNATANPYRTKNGGNGLSILTGSSTTYPTGIRDITLNEFLVFGRVLATGACDYSATSSISVVEIGERFQGASAHLDVAGIRIKNIQRTSATSLGTGVDETFEYGGILEVTFEGNDRLGNIPAVEVNMVFLVDSVNRAKSCDSAGEIEKHYLGEKKKFEDARKARDLAFTQNLDGIQSRVAGTPPAHVAVIPHLSALSPTQVALSLNMPGSSDEGNIPSKDDLKEVLADFKAKWGIP